MPKLPAGALPAFSTEPFFYKGLHDILCVRQTDRPGNSSLRGSALRPPETLLDRLLARLDAAGQDDQPLREKRDQLKQVVSACVQQRHRSPLRLSATLAGVSQAVTRHTGPTNDVAF